MGKIHIATGSLRLRDSRPACANRNTTVFLWTVILSREAVAQASSLPWRCWPRWRDPGIAKADVYDRIMASWKLAPLATQEGLFTSHFEFDPHSSFGEWSDIMVSLPSIWGREDES